MMILSSCSATVDVNSLAQAVSASHSSLPSESSDSETDSDHTDKFYTRDSETDTDIDTNTDSEETSDSDAAPAQAFDESKYLTMFVSGSAEIALSADALYGSKEIGAVKCGDRVSIVQRDVMEYCFVYSPTLEKFGYVLTDRLADYADETTPGEVYYVKPASAQIYADNGFTTPLETVSMNDMVTVIVKRTDGAWRVEDKSGRIGYIEKDLLSEKKVKLESKTESKKNSDKKTVSSQTVSQAEKKTESTVESEEKVVSGLYTGKGDAPDDYVPYIVDVDVGYLSLRAAPSAKAKTIGELYYEERVYAIDTTGDYWYIYAPNLGMYGYVTGDLNYLYPEAEN